MKQVPYNGAGDRERMLALAQAHPAGQPHVIDLPYRLCSWAFDNPGNIALWEDSGGRLLAWAVLQSPFRTVDYALHPAAPPQTFMSILSWVDFAARALLHTPYGRAAWFVAVPGENFDRRRMLESAGFAAQDAGEDAWSQVTLALDATSFLPPCPAKAGFHLRPLRGEGEAAAYTALHRAVFGSENMTESWRREAIRHPAYRPALDLVIEDADGNLAAFCVAWLAELPLTGGSWLSIPASERIVGQIEPIGVREDVRRHGLAWSVLAEAIRRLRAGGAETILVQTDNYRDRAFNFYRAAGFRVVEHISFYRHDYGPEA